MSHILVTGAAGFIGARVAELLLEEGHRVVGLDDLNDAYDVRLKGWRLGRLQARQGFEFAKADVRDRAALAGVVGGRRLDGVVHLAARAGIHPSVEDPWIYLETNATGTLNVLELCRTNGVGRFVLSSTSSLYAGLDALPFREDQPTDSPQSPYAASKKAAEALCATYRTLHGLDVTVLRYFTVYGEGGRPDMSLFRFVQRISEGLPITVFGDGSQSRDFTHVDDAARATLLALRGRCPGPINVGSDRPVTINDTIALVERLTGRSAVVCRKPKHAADVQDTWADISLARRELGWEPRVSFEDGVERLVAWYRENRDWAREIRTA
jgi:nucleoside-diphosphate-sugar epimerase